MNMHQKHVACNTCLLQFVPELPFSLLGRQVVPVVHVLMLAQVSRNLSHLSVKLDIQLFLLAEQNGILKELSKLVPK